ACVSASRAFPSGYIVRARDSLETNQEQTLYVRYLFCNHLIWSEQFKRPLKRKLKDGAAAACLGGRRTGFPNQEAAGFGERRQHGTVLGAKRCGHQLAVGTGRKSRAQV